MAFVIGVTVVVAGSGCATVSRPPSARPSDAATIDRLLGLIAERLDVASDVAQTKWNTGAPIEDVPRERQIIEGVADHAGDYGLSRDMAADFFRAQIEASKAIQRTLHTEWTASRQPAFKAVADLETEIRPHLDRLTPELLRALAAAVSVLKRPGGSQLLESRSRAIVIQTPGERAAMAEAVAPLLGIAYGASGSGEAPAGIECKCC